VALKSRLFPVFSLGATPAPPVSGAPLPIFIQEYDLRSGSAKLLWRFVSAILNMDKPNLRLDIKKSAEEGNSKCGGNKLCIQAEKMIPNVIAKRYREVLFFLPWEKSIL
jgi:hypothetical protein